jgi:hypothetical protein
MRRRRRDRERRGRVLRRTPLHPHAPADVGFPAPSSLPFSADARRARPPCAAARGVARSPYAALACPPSVRDTWSSRTAPLLGQCPGTQPSSLNSVRTLDRRPAPTRPGRTARPDRLFTGARERGCGPYDVATALQEGDKEVCGLEERQGTPTFPPIAYDQGLSPQSSPPYVIRSAAVPRSTSTVRLHSLA